MRRGAFVTEILVQFAAGIVGEFTERALLGHLLRRLHEAGPGHPSQRRRRGCGARRARPHPQRWPPRRPAGSPAWLHGFTTVAIFLGRDARRIENIGAGFGIGGEPVDHEIHPSPRAKMPRSGR